MKTRWAVPLTVLGTLVVILAAAMLVLATGAMNIGADVKPGLIEGTLAPWSRERSVDSRAPRETDPYDGDPAAIATGMDNYRANCLVCHGAPGVPSTEVSMGLNPPAPALGNVGSGVTDGDLFWVTKHGIRFTSMPAFGSTHSDDEIWKIVAFLHHLPHLTAEERRFLREGVEGELGHEERSSRAHPHDLGDR